MFGIMFIAVVAASFCGLVWVFAGAKSRLGFGQALTWSFLYLLGVAFFGFGHMIILILWCGMRPTKPGELMNDLVALAPDAPENLRHCLLDTGIAIDPKAKRIALMRRGKRKVYDFSEVREYRWSVQQGGGYAGAAPLDFSALRENIRVSRSNRENTGLFIRVRDIESPEWQILFKKKNDLRRWYEILEQAFEGRLVTG